MSGRPVVRTAALDPESLVLFKEIFGSSGHAYKQIGQGMSYSVFRRAWDSKQVTPQIVELIEGSWWVWAAKLTSKIKGIAA
jgi:hypothetical protein